MSDLNQFNFDEMTPAQFETILPELFAAGGETKVSEDIRLQRFFALHPDALALVKDLETIALHARSLFDDAPEIEPSDALWDKIQQKLGDDPEEGAVPAIV